MWNAVSIAISLLKWLLRRRDYYGDDDRRSDYTALQSALPPEQRIDDGPSAPAKARPWSAAAMVRAAQARQGRPATKAKRSHRMPAPDWRQPHTQSRKGSVPVSRLQQTIDAQPRRGVRRRSASSADSAQESVIEAQGLRERGGWSIFWLVAVILLGVILVVSYRLYAAGGWV